MKEMLGNLADGEIEFYKSVSRSTATNSELYLIVVSF